MPYPATLLASQPFCVTPERAIYDFLRIDGTGSPNMAADYSGGTTDFYIEAPAGGYLLLERALALIVDDANFTAGGYGGLAALANGLNLVVEDPGNVQVLELTSSMPIKTNQHWSRYCYDVTYASYGAGENYLAVRWTFARSGSPLVLPPGYTLRCEVSDDLSGLVEHCIGVQGYRLDA